MKRVLLLTGRGRVDRVIRTALRQAAGLEVVSVVDAHEPARGRIAYARPDVVLIDDTDGGEHSLERLREAASEAPLADRLVLTIAMRDELIHAAFEAGATAIISKAVHPIAVGTILREILRGNVAQRPRPGSRPRGASECPLTSRELEILRLAAHGMTNAQIGCRLWIAEQTVKFHLSNTYRKLGVANRTEASMYARLNDLVAA
jgi:DNA-binding NarL/FixJ family response regulator